MLGEGDRIISLVTYVVSVMFELCVMAHYAWRICGDAAMYDATAVAGVR